MEPARHAVAIVGPEPPELLVRLHAALERQGSPPIFVSRDRSRLTFLSDTGEFMLQARVADALMTVCGHDEWTRAFRSA